MSYFVSIHEDGRDAVEIVSASGHEHAADIAVPFLPQPPDDCYYVNFNGDIRVIDAEIISEVELETV